MPAPRLVAVAASAALVLLLPAAAGAKAPPKVTIDLVSPTIVGASGSSTVTWHASSGTSYSVRIGGSCTSGTQLVAGAYKKTTKVATTVAASALTEGANTVVVCVTDGTAVGSATTTITKDSIAPTVTVDSVSATTLQPGDSSLVSWHSDESGSYAVRVGGTDCGSGTSVDSGTALTSTSVGTTVSSTSLAPGDNVVRTCVTDAAANTGSATTTLTLATSSTGTAPPAPTIDSGPSSPTADRSATFTFSDTQAGVTFECRLDGGAWTACASPQSYAGPLAWGAHTFDVHAIDADGNVSPTTSTGWTIQATIVSLEFDDGRSDVYDNARSVLQSHGFHGTFFINTGFIGTNLYMTWSQVHDLAGDGNEIGGHTIDHPHLTQLTAAEQQAQICKDRNNLIAQGFQPTSFAYPYGDADATTQSLAQQCGYDSARDVTGIYSDGGCAGCPYAETLPPANPYNIRTPETIGSSTSLSVMESYVTQAKQNGGGWVNLVFHRVCDGCGDPDSITPATFTAFMDWLQSQLDATTSVQTVQQVIGGTFQPAVDPPPAPANVADGGTNAIPDPSLESDSDNNGVPDCFQVAGYGTNTVTASRTSDAHSGSWGEKVTVSGYSSGDRKLLPILDQVTCAPSVTPGQRYRIGAWYKATTPTTLLVYYRNTLGAWRYLTASASWPAASSWTQAGWTTPPMPADATAISFGLTLSSNGSVTTDDYSMAYQPPAVLNPSLEADANNDTIPDCFQTSGYGTNTRSYTRTTDAHTGSFAERVDVTSYTSGDAKVLPSQDDGRCTPWAIGGHRYQLSVWYKGTGRAWPTVFYRNSSGTWTYLSSSGSFPASSTWTQATWTTTALPSDATFITFGLALDSVGSLTTDDYALSDVG